VNIVAIHRSATIRVNPPSIPKSGDRTRATTVRTTPLDSSRVRPASRKLVSPSATRNAQTAPTIPPTRACEELDGIPRYQVRRFQTMAPTSAAATTVWVMVLGSAMSPPMVLATPTPTKAPMKLKAAAMRTAVRAGSTLVEITVATALAVS
jgi:hypothetical protein